MSAEFNGAEIEVLGRYFTNCDGDVFGLINLPDVTKAALFARYSRSPKSLRRLFLDEFYQGNKDAPREALEGLERAEGLFGRVLSEYGDDSVAQLAGVHVSIENISNVLTKVVERPRLMSYLEQSTRYIPYDSRDFSGNYRYVRPSELGGEALRFYEREMDHLFDTYSELSNSVTARLLAENDSIDNVTPAMRATLRAFALDATRGLLPAATSSNVGIFASAQAIEQLVLHLYAHPLAEARDAGGKLHGELNKMIPSLVSRLNRPERRDPWIEYLRSTRHGLSGGVGDCAPQVVGLDAAVQTGALGNTVRLLDFDRDGEAKILAAMLFEVGDVSSTQARYWAESMSCSEVNAIWTRYLGQRENRRHRPSRALERSSYHFEIESDYGAFRDLQRHRLLSISWQDLGCDLGYYLSSKMTKFEAERYSGAIEAMLDCHTRLVEEVGVKVASYCVPMAYRVRYELEINAREAMHLIELRSTPQGHESYREVAQLMYRLIDVDAGHHRVAGAMTHVDLTSADAGRLDSSEREVVRSQTGGPLNSYETDR